MLKWWKHWLTRLWLTNHAEKLGGQWRTLVDSHPTHWWRGTDLSLQIHTQLHSVSDHTVKLFALAIFCSIPSQSCCSPTLSLSRFRFLSSSRHAPSCLWRPDRGTQAALIGVDRWLCAAKASGVTAQPGWPVVVTKANACPKHTHPTQTAPLLPICQNAHQQRHFVKNAQFFHFLSFFMSCSFHLFFLAKLNFQASSYSVVYLSFLSLHALLSHTGPLLTPPGLTITSE